MMTAHIVLLTILISFIVTTTAIIIQLQHNYTVYDDSYDNKDSSKDTSK